MNEQELAGEQAEESDVTQVSTSQTEDEGHRSVEIPEGVTMEQLAQRLAEALKSSEQDRDRFVRAQAEVENVRRRSEKDLQNAHKYALERFARELLPVVDSLELGLQAAGADVAGARALREGMELTLKQLLAVLERFEIKVIDPVGQRFDPERHQAMAMEPSADVESNTVVKVFQKGYLLNDRLLRPAMVVVSQPTTATRDVDE